MARVLEFLRSPFSFLSARSTRWERGAVYLLREHRRGRSVAEILEDPYLRNRYTPEQLARLLEQPEVIHALGDDVTAAARTRLES